MISHKRRQLKLQPTQAVISAELSVAADMIETLLLAFEAGVRSALLES